MSCFSKKTYVKWVILIKNLCKMGWFSKNTYYVRWVVFSKTTYVRWIVLDRRLM